MFLPRLSSIVRAAAFLVLIGPSTFADAPEEQPLRLLHVGNSFSGNATRYLPKLAETGGKKLDIYGAIIGGCSFATHAKHLQEAKNGLEEGRAYRPAATLGAPLKDQKGVSLPEALKAKEWDVVTIQQVSNQSFQPETFEPHVTQLVEEIRSAAPKATLYIHQTWAYRPDHPLYKKQTELTPERMQALINVAYSQLGERHKINHFLPSGLAVEMASGTDEWKYRRDPAFNYDTPPSGELPKDEVSLYLGPRLSKPDKNGQRKLGFDAKHLGPAGCYLAECVWYEILFNDSVLNVDFTPKELTPEQAASLRKIAHEAVAAYRAHGLPGKPEAQ